MGASREQVILYLGTERLQPELIVNSESFSNMPLQSICYCEPLPSNAPFTGFYYTTLSGCPLTSPAAPSPPPSLARLPSISLLNVNSIQCSLLILGPSLMASISFTDSWFLSLSLERECFNPVFLTFGLTTWVIYQFFLKERKFIQMPKCDDFDYPYIIFMRCFKDINHMCACVCVP